MPDSEDLELLWKDALAAYEKETDRKLNHDALLRRLESTNDLLEQIESDGRSFHDWRNKHRKLWSSLSAFLAPITAIGGITLVAASNFPPEAAVLGSILYLIKSCEQVSNAYDWVEQIFAELQEFSDRLTQYAKSEMDAILRKKVIAILTFIVRIIGRSEVLIREKRFREYLRVTFLGRDDKTKALLDDLNKSMKNEQSYVLAVTYASSKATEEIAGRTERTVGKTSEDVQRLTQTVESLSAAAKESKDKEAEKEDDEALKHTLEDTSATKDVEEHFSTYRRSLLKGSGAWLQKEPLFDTWISQRAPILWVFGGPGAGKSYLSTWTILRLIELHDQRLDYGDGVSVSYFYIKENKEILRDPNVILKTLAWQITLVDRLFRKHAASVCKSPRSTITAGDTWENLFLDFYKSDRARDRHAIIVLDGLDEAPPAARMTILGFLRNIVAAGRATTRARIQVAVFGRSTLRGDMHFKREEKYIEVSSVKNRNDIDSYIQKRLEEVELLKELRKAKPNGPQQANKTGKRIKKKVLDGADGVFLWAKLLLDQIIKKDLTQIEKILTNPPANLDEMIWSVFDRLAKDQDVDHESVRRMLAWVAYARRPLFFGEIDLILSLPTRRPNFLLWASLRGRFASIFDLKFPKGYDPAEDDDATSNPKETDLDDDNQSTQEEEEEEAPAFDFTGDDDEGEDSENDIGSADTDVLSVEANRGLESLAVGGSPNDRHESLHIFSDGQLKTIVTFSHQRIRDYLVREGSAKTRRKAAMDIYPDVQRVQLDITMTCLEILRLGLAMTGDTRYLVDYPAKHFVWHLESIDMNAVGDEDKRQILDGLYWLFHEPTGIKSLFISAGDSEDDGYDVFWRTWLASNRHTQALRAWFGESESVASGFGDDAKAWMKSASRSIKELLRPLAMTAATQWLTKPGYDSEEYLNKSEFLVWVLQGYFGLDDDGVLGGELRDFAWYKSDFENIPAEQLQRLAEWAQLEQTTHWHTGLGWIMMEGYYYEEAISHFKEALDQDSDAWVAKEGLARCLGEQGLYNEAIEWMENAIESLPSNMSWLAGYLCPRIAEWKRATGDHEGAFEAAERAYAAEGGSALAQLRYLEALDASNFSDVIIQVIEELDGWEVLERDYSYLVRFFVLGYNAYDEIGKACRARGKPEFVLAAMDRAMTLIDQSDNESMQIWLPAQVAAFRYDYCDQVEEPMQLWETALKRIDAGDSAVQKSSAKTRKIYSNRLAQLYFDAAVASRNAGPDSAQYATKLKGLSVVTETSADDDDAFDFYGTGYASMLWGRWLRDYQDAEEGVWRKCFKARALEEMDMLDDNDPSNDTRGLHALAVTLLQAGDRTNAGAILAVLFKPLEDLPTKQVAEDDGSDIPNGGNGETDEQDSDPKMQSVTDGGESNELPSERTLKSEAAVLKPGDMSVVSPQTPQVTETRTVFGPENIDDATTQPLAPVTKQTTSQLKLELGNSWMYTCDGCFRDPQDAGEMYFCEICLNKNYCGDCLPKIKEASLWSRQCDPSHTHYRAWPIPSDARDMAVEWVEGEAALRIEWLEKLRKEWMASPVFQGHA